MLIQCQFAIWDSNNDYKTTPPMIPHGRIGVSGSAAFLAIYRLSWRDRRRRWEDHN